MIDVCILCLQNKPYALHVLYPKVHNLRLPLTVCRLHLMIFAVDSALRRRIVVDQQQRMVLLSKWFPNTHRDTGSRPAKAVVSRSAKEVWRNLWSTPYHDVYSINKELRWTNFW